MALLDALRAWWSGPEPEAVNQSFMEGRALNALFRTGTEDWWDRGNTAAGEVVNIETALRSIAVQAAIRLLVNDIGSLPLDAYRANDLEKQEIAKPGWVITPNPLNPNETWEDHVKQVVFSILSDGNAFTRCFPSVYQPESVVALDPLKVEIHTEGPDTIYAIGGARLTPNEVIHIPWMRQPGKARGMDPIATSREGLGIALAADKFVGSYFGNGAIMSGIVEVPAGVTLDDKGVQDIVAGIRKKHVGAGKSHAVGALTGGATYKQFDYNNRNAQLLELRDSIVEDVARLFGIPPHMLGSQKPGATGFASVEQRSIDYVTHAILPIARRIEIGYSRLLRGQKTYIKFNLRGLLAADAQGRSAYYTALLQNKVVRREEVRAWEDLPYDPTALGYLETPNNNAPAPATPTAPPVTNNNLTIADGAIRSETTVEPASPNVTVENHVEPAAPNVTVENRVEPAAAPAVTIENHVDPADVVVNLPEQRTMRKSIRRTDTGFELTEVPDGE